MEGLLLRLSSLDADAENAVRVIGFFDRLIATRTSLDTIVRKASELAECPMGVSSFVRGLQVGGPVPANATRRALQDDTVVWLAREGKPLPLDEMVLERFSITVALSLELSRVPLPALGDPALVELVLSDSAGEAERSRALHLLELRPTTPLRVLAVQGKPTGLSAALGPLHAVLATDEIPDQDGEVGISAQVPAIQAPAAWAEARIALRFTSPVYPVVRADDLGGQIALASLPPEQIAKLPDVIALDGLDPQLTTVLEALVRTDSIRKAAAAIHRHHSTIPARIAQAETALGFPIDTPAGRFRLQLALVLRHLRDS